MTSRSDEVSEVEAPESDPTDLRDVETVGEEGSLTPPPEMRMPQPTAENFYALCGVAFQRAMEAKGNKKALLEASSEFGHLAVACLRLEKEGAEV